jgi:hypothetical protein
MKTMTVAAAVVVALAATTSAVASTHAEAINPKFSVATMSVGQPGKLRPGEVLTAHFGHKVLRYQWYRCDRSGRRCRPIPGATHRRYRVVAADIGHRLFVKAVRKGSKGGATSAPTGVIGMPLPVNTAPPTITDGGQGGGTLSTPVVGDVLTGTTGTWTNAVRYTYAWDDCTNATPSVCTPIPGANATSYTIASTDVGNSIEFFVTAYNY